MFSPDMESSQETSEMITASSSTRRVRQPPAFLRKVYDIVSDPETDSIISWDSLGTSLIGWDPHKFADEALGKFFKHRNITTFVCQLNSYGLRRMDWERLEFKNEWFQKGKRTLLSRIKRRNQALNSSGRQKDMEAVIQEHEALKTEMMKLVRKQETLEKEMASLEKRAQVTLSKRRKTIEHILQEAFQTGTELRAENEELTLLKKTMQFWRSC